MLLFLLIHLQIYLELQPFFRKLHQTTTTRMKVDIQVISTPSSLGRASIGINFANASYIINVGESTQRLIGQNRFRLGKLRCVFSSRICWDTIGGLPGLMLSMSEIPNLNELQLFGPNRLVQFIASNSEFIKRPEMKVSLNEIAQSGLVVYKDENITVQAAVVNLKTTLKNSDYSTVKKQRLIHGMFKARIDGVNAKNGEELQLTSISYLIQLPSVPGKMDGKKATELGVEGKDRVFVFNTRKG